MSESMQQLPASAGGGLHARSRLQIWLPALVFSGLALLLMWRSLVGDVFLPLDIMPHMHPWRYSYERVPVNNPTNTDTVQQVYPRRVLTNAILRQGALPLWNPTILTGTPLLADGQTTFFYPPSFLFLLLPIGGALGYYAFLQLILAGCGTYLFARQIRLGRGPAILAGTCFMFSGYMLTWLHYPHHTGATAMLPWCFLTVACACERRRGSDWLLAGMALCLPVLTHLQVAFYTYIAVGLYVAAQFAHKRSKGARLRIAAGFCLAVVVSLGASAAQLLPQVALSVEGQRVAQIFEPLTDTGRFFYLVRLVLPATGGAPRPEHHGWGPSLLQMPQPYAGLAPLVLALLALMLSPSRMASFFGMLAALSLALALTTPLVPLLIRLVPAYGQFRDQARWFVLWGFAVAILAGLGAEAVATRRKAASASERRTLRLNRLGLALTLLGVAVWALPHLALFTPASRYGAYITAVRQQDLGVPALLAVASGAALLLLRAIGLPPLLRWGVLTSVVVADVLWYGGSYNTTEAPALFKPTADLVAALPRATMPSSRDLLYPPTRQIAFLLQQPQPFRFHAGDYPALLPNFATTFGLEDIRGYQSLYLARYNRLVRLIDGKDYRRLAGEGATSFEPYLTSAYKHRRLLDMLNVQFIVFPPASKNPPLYAPLELVQQNDEGTIYRNPQALPRAWLVHAVEAIPNDEAQLDRMARPDFDPAATVVLPSMPPPVALSSTPEAVPRVTYAPNSVLVHAQVAAPAVLVVSDAYTSDWRVEVDGKAAPLYRANYAFRGVWLPAGEHTVTFSYRPHSFLLGSILSLTTIATVIAYGTFMWRRERSMRGNTTARWNNDAENRRHTLTERRASYGR